MSSHDDEEEENPLWRWSFLAVFALVGIYAGIWWITPS